MRRAGAVARGGGAGGGPSSRDAFMQMLGLPTIVVWAASGAINFSTEGLRQTYDLISIGRPIPPALSAPAGVRWTALRKGSGGARIRQIELSQASALSQRRERVAVWIDADGRALAKYYHGYREEVRILTLWYASRDEAIWEVRQEFVDASLSSPGLRGYRTPLGVLEIICRTLLDASDRSQFSNRIVELFNRAHDQAGPTDANPESVVSPKRRNGLSMRIAKRRGVIRVEIAEAHNRSLVIWTLYGYAYALTHGGRLP